MDDLDFLVARLLTGGEQERLGSHEAERLMSHVTRYASSVVSGLSKEDLDDIASEALARLLAAAEKQILDESRSPAGYLLRTAGNLAIDHARRQLREEPRELAADDSWERQTARPLEEARIDDDAIARLLSAVADAQTVMLGLAAAVAARDETAHRIVLHWLTLAERLGQAPTTRLVAAAAGVSHTTVATALRRFAGYLGSPVVGADEQPGP